MVWTESRINPNCAQKLLELLKTLSFRRGGDARLREAERLLLDTKPTMLDAGAGLLAELILHELKDAKADCVGGIELGAVQ
jgi:hypothetical protein